MAQRRGSTAAVPALHRLPLRPARERWMAWGLLGVVVVAAVVATRTGTHGETDLSLVRIAIFVAFSAALAAALAWKGRQHRRGIDLTGR